MRVFKSKRFAKFALKEGISDEKLCAAVNELEHGKIDADYGGGVVKQRVARLNAGKSSGYRTIILFQKGVLSFFVYGFSKSERANIDKEDESAFKELAKKLLAASASDLARLVENNEFMEVKYNGHNQSL